MAYSSLTPWNRRRDLIRVNSWYPVNPLTRVSQPSIDQAQRCLTSVIVRELTFPSWSAAVQIYQIHLSLLVVTYLPDRLVGFHCHWQGDLLATFKLLSFRTKATEILCPQLNRSRKQGWRLELDWKIQDPRSRTFLLDWFSWLLKGFLCCPKMKFGCIKKLGKK